MFCRKKIVSMKTRPKLITVITEHVTRRRGLYTIVKSEVIRLKTHDAS